MDITIAMQADKWKDFPSDGNREYRSTWSWMTAFDYYQREPRRFEIAIWGCGILCGICYGRPSRGKTRMRLDLLEATPVKPNPIGIRVFPVVANAAIYYANLIGAEELCLLDPLNDEVIEYYMKFGFSEPYPYHGKGVRKRIALRKIL